MTNERKRCTATSRQTGERCKLPPSKGGTVCRYHGGASPRTAAKAKRNVAKQYAEAAVKRFNANPDVDPAMALLELVQYQAGVVAYFREKVEELRENDLQWSTVEHQHGVDGEDTKSVYTEQATPHPSYKLLDEAQQRLATYSAAAVKAGVEVRRVRIAERQGLAFAAVQQSILDAMWQVVEKSVGASEELREEWDKAVAVVVPREVRRLAGTP